MFTVFHNRASDILRWTLASKISRGSGPLNPCRIDAYVKPSFVIFDIRARVPGCQKLQMTA